MFSTEFWLKTTTTNIPVKFSSCFNFTEHPTTGLTQLRDSRVGDMWWGIWNIVLRQWEDRLDYSVESEIQMLVSCWRKPNTILLIAGWCRWSEISNCSEPGRNFPIDLWGDRRLSLILFQLVMAYWPSIVVAGVVKALLCPGTSWGVS